jgi:hypothetical protein
LAAIPTFLCIDVEPDERGVLIGERPPWRGFDALSEHLQRLRPRLARATGRPVAFAWFPRIDPQIESCYGDAAYALGAFEDRFTALRANGDVVGVHPHSFRFDAAAGRWRSDYADADWAQHCQTMAFEAFHARTGEACALHRYGDHFLSRDLVANAERLGARVDLTAEPGLRPVRRLARGELVTGALPDYRGLPREPYRASTGDFRVPDEHRNAGMWIVPLTAADPRAAEAFPRRLLRRMTLHGQPAHRPLLPHRPWRSARAYWDLVAAYLDTMERPYLAVALRTERPDHPVAVRVRALLDELIDHPVAARLSFVDPVGAIDRLTATNTAAQ